MLLLLGFLTLVFLIFNCYHHFKSCRIVFIFCVSIFISGVFSSLTFRPKYKLCAGSFNSIIAPSSKDCYFRSQNGFHVLSNLVVQQRRQSGNVAVDDPVGRRPLQHLGLPRRPLGLGSGF
jgi:hypothetical protein